MVGLLPPRSPFIWLRDYPTAVMEASFRARDQREVHSQLEALTLALRLFKVGSVVNFQTVWRSESILQWGGTSFKSDVRTEAYKYSLSEMDIPELRKFIETITPLFPQKLTNPSANEIDYSVIAVQRYNDAVLKPETAESRLTSAIMALESLYLKEMERGELEHRLSQRVSRLLGFYGFEPLEVYTTVKRSYGIRSSFVHGSPIPKEDLQEVSKLAKKVAEYARFSIVLFLQLKSKFEKDKFLNKIDNSLLSAKAFDRLERVLKKNCTIYSARIAETVEH